MKKIGLVLFVAMLSFASSAQENITKLTVSPGLLGPKGDTINPTVGVYNWLIGIAQERKVSDRMSVQLGFKFSNKNLDVNEFTGATYADSSYNPFNNASLFSWTATAALRIYGKDKGALNGFYWGPYLNYGSNKLNTEPDFVSITDEFGEVFYGDVQQIIGLTNVGLGLQIGTQKVWDGGMVLDWTILGIGFNQYTASLKYDVTKTSGNFDFRDYEADIDEVALDIEDWGDVSYTIEKESVEAKFNRSFLHFRMGLALGFGYGN